MRRIGKTGVVMLVAALLVPALGYAIGGSQVPAAAIRPAAATVRAPASRPVPRTAGCRGLGYEAIPARGHVSNPDGTQGGSVRWAQEHGHVVCIGTVRMWVSYPVREYAHWLVVIYGGYAMPEIIADAAFTAGPGSYYWDFRITRQFRGPFFLCLIAGLWAGPAASPGITCARLG
jgi:hypothetical protein